MRNKNLSQSIKLPVSVVTFVVFCFLLSFDAMAKASHTIAVQATDIIYVQSKDRIYAAVDSNSASFPNSVTVINPSTGATGPSIAVSRRPRRLAISDDERYLYVAVDGPRIIRIDLNSGSVDSDFSVSIGTQFFQCPSPLRAFDVQVMPGHSQTIAVSFMCDDFGLPEGIAIFDGSVRRTQTVPGNIKVSTIIFAGDDSTLWGYNSLDTGFKLWRFDISKSGISVATENCVPRESITRLKRKAKERDCIPADVGRAGLLYGFNPFVRSSDGLLYGVNGRVVDPVRGSFPGRFLSNDVLFSSSVAIDQAANRIYFPERDGFDFSISEFDMDTYLPTRYYRETFAGIGGRAMKMTRCGNAGLAMIDENSGNVVIFSLSLLSPVPSLPIPTPVMIAGGIYKIALPNYTIAYDSKNQMLYSGTPSFLGNIGNSILPIDPISGIAGNPVWVGSEPQRLAVSDGGQYLYVGLYGTCAIRRLQLPFLASDLQFTVFSDEGSFALYLTPAPTRTSQIIPLPGLPESVLVARADEPGSDLPGANGIAIYDRGIKRPLVNPQHSNQGGLKTNTIQLSDSGNEIYGLDTEDTGNTFSQFSIDFKGIHYVSAKANLGVSGGPFTFLKCQNGRCFTSYGNIIDPVAMKHIGDFPLNQLAGNTFSYVAVTPDLPNSRVYFLSTTNTDSYITAFDSNTLQAVSSLKVPGVTGQILDFLLLDNGKFAFSTGDQIVLVPMSLLQPRTSTPAVKGLRNDKTNIPAKTETIRKPSSTRPRF